MVYDVLYPLRRNAAPSQDVGQKRSYLVRTLRSTKADDEHGVERRRLGHLAMMPQAARPVIAWRPCHDWPLASACCFRNATCLIGSNEQPPLASKASKYSPRTRQARRTLAIGCGGTGYPRCCSTLNLRSPRCRGAKRNSERPSLARSSTLPQPAAPSYTVWPAWPAGRPPRRHSSGIYAGGLKPPAPSTSHSWSSRSTPGTTQDTS